MSTLMSSLPECRVPWCERRVYDGDEMELCKNHSDQWMFNLWQTMMVQQARKAVQEQEEASSLKDIAVPGKDF